MAAVDKPYVGLRPFQQEDALVFFGRREQTSELLELLGGHHFLGIVGSSGCGKSSLVRAGLIPALLGGFLVDERRRWRFAKIKPGDAPMHQLATGLCAAGGEVTEAGVEALLEAVRERSTGAIVDHVMPLLGEDTNLLLLVDQFEEIFTFRGAGDDAEIGEQELERRRERAKRRAEAAEFVDLLLELGEMADLPIYTVLTMRTDFLGDCDIFYGLPEAMNQGRYLVPRLTRQQLRDAIEGPVRMAGAEVSPRLVERLLHELGDRADRLPVLQHALLRTWQYWQEAGGDGPVDLAHYRAVGGLEQALAHHAGESAAGVEAALAARIFKCLTDTDPAGRRIRRPCRLSELEAVSGASAEKVMEVLRRFREEDRHFVYWSDDTDPLVNISHESLIRQWGKLEGWVDEERRDRDHFLELVSRARGEAEGDKELLRGREVEAVLEWRQSVRPTAAWAERYRKGEDDFQAATSYVDRSRRADEEAGQKEREKQLRIRHLAIASAIVSLVAIALLVVASFSRAQLRDALEEAESAREETLAALANLEEEEIKTKNALILRTKALNEAQQAKRDIEIAFVRLEVEERAKEKALQEAKLAREEAEGRLRELTEVREELAAYRQDQEFSTVKAEPAADEPPEVRKGRKEQVTANNRVVPDDTHYPEQWSLFENGDGPGQSPGGINLPLAWSQSIGSASVVVAVLGTGIVTDHPDLLGSPNVIAGWDMVSNSKLSADGDGRDEDPTDPGDECNSGQSSWQGNHSAGVVGAGWTNNDLGISGVSWKVSVLPVRVLGQCGGTYGDIADGVRWAAGLPVPGVPANRTPAKVIFIDAGGAGACSSSRQRDFRAAIDEAIQAGVTIVAAAGNSGSDAANDTPASCEGVIAVAASDFRGHLVTRYSNFGDVVDLLAPGGDLQRDDNADGEPDGILSLTANGYASYQGTSQAAAHVAGVAALLLSREPTLTPEQVRQRLMANAIPRDTVQCPRPCGAGLLNAYFPPKRPE